MHLTYLCDMELAHEGTPAMVRPYGTEEGMVFGSGGGAVTGDRLRGTARWANHARRRSDGAMLPDMQGIITTEDGAKIWFSMHGRTTWVDSVHGHLGNQLLQVLFETDDERYRWLNDAVCVLEGRVDLQADRGPARPQHLGPARVYVCVSDLL